MLKDLLESPPPTTTTPLSRSKRPTGAIVGGTIGGLVLVVAIIYICYFLWRRRNKKHAKSQDGNLVQDANTMQPIAIELENSSRGAEANPPARGGSPVEVDGQN